MNVIIRLQVFIVMNTRMSSGCDMYSCRPTQIFLEAWCLHLHNQSHLDQKWPDYKEARHWPTKEHVKVLFHRRAGLSNHLHMLLCWNMSLS